MAFSHHHPHLPLYNSPNNPYNPTLYYPNMDYLSFHYPVVEHHYYNIINLPPHNFGYQQQQQQHHYNIMYHLPITYSANYPSRNSNNVIHRVDDSWVLDQQQIISLEQTGEESAPSASSFLQEETAILDEEDTTSVEIEPSYEDFLLFEQILMGQANSELSVETIMQHLKTRDYIAAATEDEDEGDICVICQSEYENEELIGGLHCGHEYHEQCIIRWLQQNNTCPICKAAAVS